MNLTKPHWTNGLELGPHHFQLQDRYHEELVDHRLSSLCDHAWGIHEIRWDARAIGTGQAALRKLDAILPDGTPLSWDAAEGVPGPSVAIEDLGPKGRLAIYLGVPRLRTGSNVDGESKGEVRRYSRETVTMPDLSGGTEPRRLEALRPNVRLLLEGERLDDWVTMPCAHVIRAASGQLAFDDGFVPPVLAVNASPYLARELRRALDTLLARQALASRASANDVNEIVQRWITSIVGSGAARVSDLVHQRFVHPHTAYLALAELLGSLSPFSRTGTHRIPPFEFDRLGPVFAELFAGLGALLDAVSAERHRRIDLIRYDGATLFANLSEPAIFRNDFFLRVMGPDLDDLRARVPQHCKVAAWPDLPEIVKAATTAVVLKHEPRPPGTLPGGQGSLYFRLEKNDAFGSVIKHGQLGIHHVPSLQVADIALFAVEPGAS